MTFRDAATGLPFDSQVAYEADPPDRTADITPYMSDADSEGIFKQPVTPNQPSFDTDKGITS